MISGINIQEYEGVCTYFSFFLFGLLRVWRALASRWQPERCKKMCYVLGWHDLVVWGNLGCSCDIGRLFTWNLVALLVEWSNMEQPYFCITWCWYNSLGTWLRTPNWPKSADGTANMGKPLVYISFYCFRSLFFTAPTDHKGVVLRRNNALEE